MAWCFTLRQPTALHVPGFGSELQPGPLKQEHLGEEGSRLSRKISASSFVTEGGTLHLIN